MRKFARKTREYSLNPHDPRSIRRLIEGVQEQAEESSDDIIQGIFFAPNPAVGDGHYHGREHYLPDTTIIACQPD
jgi:hypothetical protein